MGSQHKTSVVTEGTFRTPCRICTNHCALTVEVRGGEVIDVRGDPDDPLYAGFTCVKGRAQPEYLRGPQRILRPLKRINGEFREIPMDQALDEIAERLSRIVAEHGPRAIATWAGTMQTATKATSVPLLSALMDAIGSPFRFDPNTIDKGGKQIAASLLGQWQAPAYGFVDPQAILLIGINPLATCTGLPAGNPGGWLKQAMRKGTQLVVIDPRRSDIAKRATLHLQPRPGHDARILAAMIRTILAEGLEDSAFIAEHTRGLEELRAAVAPFSPEAVGAAAGLAAADIVAAARIYGSARRAYTMAGTGPHMSGPGGLVEYLVLAMDTVCGNWMRAGEVVEALPVLTPLREYRAQATPPVAQWRGEEQFVRGLSQTPAGLPTAAMIDHMLPNREDRFRAVISIAGNPLAAFPGHAKTREAFGALDLLVQVDPYLSETARMADYVLPPLMPLETLASTYHLDCSTGRATGYGMGTAYGHASYAVVPPPPGSDLLEEWQMIAGIGRRMGLALQPRRSDGSAVDLRQGMSSEELFEEMVRDARVPLGQVLDRDGGAIFSDPEVRVLPRQEGWEGRLDLGSAVMLDELVQTPGGDRAAGEGYPLRLVCRRERYIYNSSCHVTATNRGRFHNPAFLHPDDIAALALQAGDAVRVSSPFGAIDGVVEADPGLRPGLVSMSFAHGKQGASYAESGSNINVLTSNDAVFDPFTGQPLMSNVPVRVEALESVQA